MRGCDRRCLKVAVIIARGVSMIIQAEEKVIDMFLIETERKRRKGRKLTGESKKGKYIRMQRCLRVDVTIIT